VDTMNCTFWALSRPLYYGSAQPAWEQVIYADKVQDCAGNVCVSLALSCRCAADTCEGTSSGAHGAQACAAQPETQWPWAQASGDMQQLLPASHACGQDCKSFVAQSNAVHLGQACSTLVQYARHDHNGLREPCKAVIAFNSCCITKPV
jgi:hypothetical protein